MKKRNQIPSALRHGAYSGTTLLPGEDAVAFRKLRNDLVDEFGPTGPLEEDIVEEIARLMWRKQNLLTYRLADKARSRFFAIRSKLEPKEDCEESLLSPWNVRNSDEVLAANQAAEEQARNELGSVAWKLVELDEVAKTDYLLDELSLIDRLDGMIDRCLKRILFLKGIKSLSAPSSTGALASRNGPKALD